MLVNTRLATRADLEPMVGLLQELFAIERDFACDPDKQRQGLEMLLQQPQTCRVIVVELDGHVVGMCSLHIHVSTAEGAWVGIIEDVVVTRHCRGRGLGRHLLAAAERTAAYLGLPRLQLLADQNNGAALTFYRQAGWTRTNLIGLRKTSESFGRCPQVTGQACLPARRAAYRKGDRSVVS
jgi:ribosomal protein S18 acetylase RimI-like enzyme